MSSHPQRFRKQHRHAEPHETYSFYLPKALMVMFQELTKSMKRSDSDAMTEAARLFLAVNSHNTIVSVNGESHD